MWGGTSCGHRHLPLSQAGTQGGGSTPRPPCHCPHGPHLLGDSSSCTGGVVVPPQARGAGDAPHRWPHATLWAAAAGEQGRGGGGVRGGCPPALGAPGQQLVLSPAAPLTRDRGSGLMLLREGGGHGGRCWGSGEGAPLHSGRGQGGQGPRSGSGDSPHSKSLGENQWDGVLSQCPPLPSSAARLSSTLLCRGCSCGVSAPVVPRQSPPPSGSGFAAVPAGRCCPSKPCSNGPQSWPRQIRHPPRAGRGGP